MKYNKLKKKLTLLGLVFMTTLNSSGSKGVINEKIPFDKNLIQNEIDIDSDSYVIQGICVIDNYIFVTAYNDLISKSSKVFIYDLNMNFIKETLLNNNSHVGGIAYDSKNQIVWITDIQGTISGYNKDEFIINDSISPKFYRLDVSKDLVNLYGNSSVAYIAYHDGYIFLGDYTAEAFSTMKKYKILDNGSINPDEYEKVYFYGLVQGLSFYDYNGNTYMFVSSSISNKFKSNMKLVKYDPNVKDYRNEKCVNFEMPNMLEQIYMSNDSKLYSAYESNAEKYFSGTKHSGDILIEDFDEKIDEYINKL